MTAHIRRTLPLLLVAIISLTIVTVLNITTTNGNEFDFTANQESNSSTSTSTSTSITKTISRTDIPLFINSSARILASQKNILVSEVTGEIVERNSALERGDMISKGELLYRIENTHYLSGVAEARQILASAKLELASEVARQAQAKEDLNNLEANNISDLALRKPQLTLAQATLASAQARLAVAQKQLSRTKIVAPYNGFVIQRIAETNDILEPFSPLIEIYAKNQRRINIQLAQKQWQSLRSMISTIKDHNDSIENINTQDLTALLKVTLSSPELDEPIPLNASKILLSAELDPQTRLQTITIVVDDAELRKNTYQLIPESLATITLTAGKLNDVFQLPISEFPKNKSISFLDENGNIISKIANIILNNDGIIIFDLPIKNKTIRLKKNSPQRIKLSTVHNIEKKESHHVF